MFKFEADTLVWPLLEDLTLQCDPPRGIRSPGVASPLGSDSLMWPLRWDQ
jgi:hypothetical protein